MIYDKTRMYDALDLIAQLQETLTLATYAIQQLPIVEAERDEWRRRHFKLVDEDIKNSEATTASLLRLVLEGRITVPKNTEGEDFKP